ncbi:MAG: hypothetical protein OEZ00_03265 [Dehalococcoidia bacterium]|nr:hypothetical protein [Dehalococcoidia bacterium]
MNGHQVGWDNKIFDALKTHPFDPVMGSNMLDFIVKNWAQGSEGNLRDQIGNPNGLTYKATIEWADKETAWGTGVDFGGANWAMYFMYTVQPCVSGQVMNGGFEAPVVTTSQGWHIYDSGTEGLGWTVDWYDPEGKWIASAPSPAHLELHHGVNNWQSYKGGQHAELDTDWGGPSDPGSGEPASVRIYQDIKTCPCKTYTLTYAWSPRPGHADNQLEVHWGSTKLATHTASGTGNANTSWTLQTWTGLSGNPSGTTRLMFIEVGKPDSLGVFLDEVSVAEE